jgi:transketolase
MVDHADLRAVAVGNEKFIPLFCQIGNHGGDMSESVELFRRIAAKGISAKVLDMHTVKPLDVDAVKDCIENIGKIITIEDHNILNGLGSAVADVVAESGKAVLRRIGIQDQFGQSAPYERLLEMNGVTVENIVAQAKTLIG